MATPVVPTPTDKAKAISVNGIPNACKILPAFNNRRIKKTPPLFLKNGVYYSKD
jgi:hypothetical protein